MIIGVSGYAGSGKDTVGAIIQYIVASKYINTGISVEEYVNNISDYEEEMQVDSGWEIRKFAGKLKDIASHLTGIDIEDLEDQEFKKTNLGREWWTTCDEGWQPMTVREFLQKLGTDAMRRGLHENVWVNALMADYKPESLDRNGEETNQYPNWVITDTRFPNEAQAIKDHGGIILRIDRPGTKPINNHPSETGLDHWKFDYKIANVSDLLSLQFTIENILKHLNLIK